MSLLKSHWKKFIIASFATLWASCSEDSPSQPETPPPSSAQQEVSSSSQEATPAIASSSSETIPPAMESSSSEIIPESSSAQSVSSSSQESIPTFASSSSVVIPESSSMLTQTSSFSSTDGSECIEITTFESVVLNKNDNCGDTCPVYGVPQTMNIPHTSYRCSDGSTYSLDSYKSKFGHDPIIIDKRSPSDYFKY